MENGSEYPMAWKSEGARDGLSKRYLGICTEAADEFSYSRPRHKEAFTGGLTKG